MMFLCEYIVKGVIYERFYRFGESEKEILDGLLLFVWPKGGYWSINPVGYDE